MRFQFFFVLFPFLFLNHSVYANDSNSDPHNELTTYQRYLVTGETCSEVSNLKKEPLYSRKNIRHLFSISMNPLIGSCESIGGTLTCLSAAGLTSFTTTITFGSTAIVGAPLFIAGLIAALDGAGRVVPLSQSILNTIHDPKTGERVTCHAGIFGIDDLFILIYSNSRFASSEDFQNLAKKIESRTLQANELTLAISDYAQKNSEEFIEKIEGYLNDENLIETHPEIYLKVQTALDEFKEGMKTI